MTRDYLQNCTRVKRIHAKGLLSADAALLDAAMSNERTLVRDFVKRATDALETDYTGLARRAGVAPSTITRFMRSGDAPLLTTRTLAKIAAAAGLPLPGGSIGQIPDEARISALKAVATALGIDLTEASLTDRQRAWLDAIERIPATIENHALEMVRGLGDTAGPPQQESSPSERGGRRRKSQTPP